MESADRNARLIQDYLKGAKALEWNKYTLGEIGSRLWERLSEYNGSKETRLASPSIKARRVSLSSGRVFLRLS